MKKVFIFFAGISLLIAFGSVSAEYGISREMTGDQTYTGYFDGLEDETLYIRLSETGSRVALQVSEKTEWLYKVNDYAPYDPQKLIFHALIKAIEIEERVEQVIILEVPS